MPSTGLPTPLLAANNAIATASTFARARRHNVGVRLDVRLLDGRERDPRAHSRARGTFNGNITVSNLEPGETYTFLVRGAAGEQVVCSGAASASGTFTCSAQKLTLAGFHDGRRP